ncbi:MAG: DUF4419 domain-containing protein [Prevotellaceae bacterium]|jgi:hypothetical protein|nr:DUF4419 domain-containing protein [Prevotellaceae bacterium]
MKKIIVFSVLFLFGSMCVLKAQDVYPIEDLTPPQSALLCTGLYDKVKQHLLAISVTKDSLVLNDNAHPVLYGFLKAYQDHRPITISPDIIWLLISQGFAQHVNNNAETLRSRFVDFEGQKELSVTREVPYLELSKFPWPTIFPEFTQKIGDYTGQELIGALTPDFSTSTPASVIAGQVTVMESMKKYFNYKVVFVGCGIPSVTIEGTVADWEKILEKIDVIEKYDLEWWTSLLKPIIKEIIQTKSGKLDKEFWMNMVRYHKKGIYGSLDDIDGWLVKFYPYDNRGNRMDFTKISNMNIIPSELVRVPFTFVIIYQDGSSVEHEMEFWAGFMGLKQNPLTFNLKPEIGWAVNQLAEEDEKSNWNDPMGGDNEANIKTMAETLQNRLDIALALIDGKEGSINDLKPEDIKSFKILRTEEEVKPYGEKGKNGVILITLNKKEL